MMAIYFIFSLKGIYWDIVSRFDMLGIYLGLYVSRVQTSIL